MGSETERFRINVAAGENPDWDYARTLRVLLRRRGCAWGASVCSVVWQLDGDRYVVPNRDYPYEGFFASLEGERWKFLDALAFTVKRGEEWLLPNPESVEILPWKAHYCYSIPGGNLTVGYFLVGCTSEYTAAALRVCFWFKGSMPSELTIAPLVDIRHMYEASAPDEHRTEPVPNGIIVHRRGRILMVVVEGEGRFSPRHRVCNWLYKLDDGFREQTDQGIMFVGERRALYAPGVLTAEPRNPLRIWVVAATSRGAALRYLRWARDNHLLIEEEDSRTADRIYQRIRRIFRDEKRRLALTARIFTLRSFGVPVPLPEGGYVLLPEAGAFWFASPWFRDLAVGVLANLRTYTEILEDRAFLRALAKALLRLQHPRLALIPNRLPTYFEHTLLLWSRYFPEYYRSVDATPLCFTLLFRLARLLDDRELAEETAKAFARLLSTLPNNSPDDVNGPPVLTKEGLLLAVPSHSWIDSKIPVVHKDLRIDRAPSRIPSTWVPELFKRVGRQKEELERELFRPKYLMVEVNAHWLVALQEALNTIETFNSFPDPDPSYLKELYTRASQAFTRTFWSDQHQTLFLTVYHDGSLTDPTFGSPAVEAAAVVPQGVLSDQQLRTILEKAQQRTVFRRLTTVGKGRAPLGLPVRDVEPRPYLGDSEYHGPVVWLRDTYFLALLAHRLNERELLRRILTAVLDHQEGEGAVHFCAELFSLPVGRNPSPCPPHAENPVPVKNPAQYWSHWCDPFFWLL